MTNNETVQTLDNPEIQSFLPAEYLFVFCTHTPEYADQLSHAVSDCDTVAFEYGAIKTAGERKEWETRLTRYVSSSATDEEKNETAELAEEYFADSYVWAVVVELTGSDKTIALIDMDQDSPGFDTYRNFLETQETYCDALDSTTPSAELKNLALEYLEATRASFSVREACMIEQLKKLGSQPGKIGVMAGAMHTPLQNALASVAETHRTVVGAEVNESGIIGYGYADTLLDQSRVSKDTFISDETLSRVVLLHLLESYEPDLGEHTPTELIISTSDVNVAALLAKFDGIRKSKALDETETNATEHGWMRFALSRGDTIEEQAVQDLVEATWPAVAQNQPAPTLTH